MGAGKSNFIQFFNLLNNIVSQNLQNYVAANGGADSFLYFGRKTSESFSGSVSFGQNKYEFEIAATLDNNFYFQQEVETYHHQNYKQPWRKNLASGNKLSQVIKIVEQFIHSNIIQINPPLFYQDDLKRRLILTLNMTKIVNHIWKAIRFENTKSITPVFDSDRPIRSTGDMRTWYTSKPCEYTKKSHINFCVFDSTWEASQAFELDNDPVVKAWVKNDHIGFEISYSTRELFINTDRIL